MTRVRIFREGKHIQGFEISGHTGYADHGEDIVCAAISAVSQTCAIGITEVLRIKADTFADGESGLLRLSLPTGESSGEAQAVLATMIAGLKSIQDQYPDYLRITFLKRR